MPWHLVLLLNYQEVSYHQESKNHWKEEKLKVNLLAGRREAKEQEN